MSILSTLGASVVGSLHCAAMCGGFVALATAPTRQTQSASPLRSSLATITSYQAGRLVAYASLGMLAGTVGFALEASSSLMGMRPVAGLTLLVLVVVACLATLVPPRKLITLQAKRPTLDWRSKIRMRVLSWQEKLGPLPFAAMLGLMSAFLPCAWLWGFVMLAASTGSAGDGALTMAAFWLGAIPALTGASAFFYALRRHLGAMAPRVVALTLIALAAFNLFQRWPSSTSTALVHECHHDE